MKRVLSLVLALSMVMSMFTFSFAGTSLKDVAGTEYESAVEALVELGIVNGYKDGTYLPENVVSRSEMAKLLVVAAGLAPAAELAEGTTKFSDVAADHWATGYINVAAEYGYVMGDPDGSFRPDDTVSYAEAITMALRVLGYKTVVEAKGTWPTNYIAKAEELDLLEDITYGTYAAGAARGNVALLIWNMLRTDMWAIDSESEGDGLTYRQSEAMLNIKFKDFKYGHAEFDSWANDEGEIEVTLSSVAEYTDDVTGTYTYTDTDFYTFVDGSIVEVLVNTKDKTLLSMVRTDDYKYFAGSEVEIDEEYDDNELSGDAYIYAYLLIDGKDIEDAVVVTAVSEYIYELDDSSSKRLKYNGTKGGSLNYEAYEEEIILKDDEFATVKDLEVGDVWTTIYLNGSRTPAFYMIAGAEGEGKLTKLVEKDFENTSAGTYYVATIAGEEIVVAGEAVYFEDAEDVDDTEEASFLGATSKFEDMKNEVVTYVTDVFGRIVAVMFDGELNKGGEDEGADESKFYALNGSVERDGKTYSIAVATEDGEDELVFAKGVGNEFWVADADLAGYFMIVTLNDDDEVEVLGYDYSGETNGTAFIVRADDSGDVDDFDGLELIYNEDGDKYTVSGEASVTFDENKLLVGGNTWARVNDDTVVVTLVFDDKGNDKDSDDEYRVEFAGIEAIEKMKNDPAIVITDNGESNFARAKYVVIFDEVSSREDDLVGIVKDITVNKLGDTVITVVEDRDDEAKDGTEYILVSSNVGDLDLLQFIIYSIEENDDGEWEMTIVDELSDDELVSGESLHAYIAEAEKDKPSNVSEDGREVIFDGIGKFDMDDEDTKEALEDARIYIVNVVLDEDESETQYFVDNYTEVAYEDVELKELDRVSFLPNANDPDFILIIRGMEAR